VLAADGLGLRCTSCDHRFPSQYGVPILYPSDNAPSAALDDAVTRLCGADPARRAVITAVAARLRRNERPPGLWRRLAWRLEQRAGFGG
jgi:hypothetical protein